ncbi:TRM-domain-containing protein [Aaosphaeria arxii CBS 175.79]|uniref:tRNA (guanine(26)-N(2))-dimethyltransferase n=1 Tax=Aaosphaeria arxii CBS 175.79 TaxID=1450172 RepID=A0A6A5XT47_9PLEO|nr:TRM-domain-containing protein [Aaosphaeria arxii CBS 175.79]KAF2016089.1 TRM-domain-containing protein [Aaosphaeria arxii CBS 175.79]
MATVTPPVSDISAKPSSLDSIDAIPQEGQTINHDGKAYTTIREGQAYILVPHGIPTSTDPKSSKEEVERQQVFYNPIQQFNRDLSVLAIKTYGNDLVQRKTEKHERYRAKAQRLAERKKAKTVETKVEVPPEAHPQPDDLSLKKRKLSDHMIPGPVTSGQDTDAGKKRCLADVHDSNAETEPLRNPPSTGNGHTPRVEELQKPAEWKPAFTILDALSATGLRALRYAQEIPASTSITANDMSSKATDSIRLNVKHNKLESKIQANTGNAIAYMYSRIEKQGYDVIDLDPYGTAAPFIDAAIQAINDEGMLCVTCTDSAIFASHGYLEKTYSQYGGLPLKGEPCHEGGLRLLLHAIASSAGRYGMAIEPLLSLSIDYYIRVFVRVRKSPNEVKLLAGKTMIVYHCDSGCGSWSTQFLARNKAKQNRDGTSSYKHSFAAAPSADQHCEHCGFKTHLSGPMYGGPIHNVGFIQRVLAQLNEAERSVYPTYNRIEGMLRTALEEITYGAKSAETTEDGVTKQLGPIIPKSDPAAIDDWPFFFIPSAISRVLHCQAPSLAAMRGALRHAGFRVTMSHCKPGSIRTDAPWTAIWHILLEWVRQRAPLKNALKKGTAGDVILAKGSSFAVQDNANPNPVSSTDIVNIAKEDPSNPDNADLSAAETNQTKKTLPSYLGTNFPVEFDENLGRDHDRGKYVRYQLAPRENWGPMSRAK